MHFTSFIYNWIQVIILSSYLKLTIGQICQGNSNPPCSLNCLPYDGKCYSKLDNSCTSITIKEQCLAHQKRGICYWKQEKVTQTSQTNPTTTVSTSEDDFDSIFNEESTNAQLIDVYEDKCYKYEQTSQTCKDMEIKECQSQTEKLCVYDVTCLTLTTDLDTEKITSLSYLACKLNTAKQTQFDDTKDLPCVSLSSDSKQCSDAHNFKACQHTYLNEKQCEWKVPDSKLAADAKCQEYVPTKCEGTDSLNIKPLQYICEKVQLKCKWQLNTSECKTYDEKTEQKCASSSFKLNEYACIESTMQCKWNKKLDSTPGSCEVIDVSSLSNKDKCEDGRNKYACRMSPAACAWDVSGCVQFNNYTHNCEDNLSKKACQEVPFPCGWLTSSQNFICSWYNDDEHGCDNAANEVACLISNKQCVWDTSNPNTPLCKSDTNKQDDEMFWEKWDEDNFSEEFIKQFMEEQEKAAQELLDKLKKQAEGLAQTTQNETNSTNSSSGPNVNQPNSQTDGETFSIFLSATIFILGFILY